MPNGKWITPPAQSFAGLPVATQLNAVEADIAIIGLHYHSPYKDDLSSLRTPLHSGGNQISEKEGSRLFL